MLVAQILFTTVPPAPETVPDMYKAISKYLPGAEVKLKCKWMLDSEKQG